MSDRPRVFISYSHDSAAQRDRVLELTERLRRDGIDVTLDQYVENAGPPEGWPRWTDKHLRTSDFVIVVCTAAYRRRVEGGEEPGRGHGAVWEGHFVYQYIYDSASSNTRFVPVLLDGASEEDVPTLFRGMPRYQPGDQNGYDALYRRLTSQPRIEPGALGDIKRLPARKIEPGALPERREGPVRRRVTGRTLALAAALVVLVSLASLWVSRAPAVYNVRVAVLDPHGRPVENAAVTSSVGGAVIASDAGWQIVIPAASRPADGRVTVRASAPAAFLQGRAEVRLGRSGTVTTTVQMTKPADTRVRGYAIDTAQRRLAGVRVSVAGAAGEVVTGADGTFSLPAQAADGQQVQILAEKDGYRPLTMWHPAGDEPAVLVLERSAGVT